jgi:pimeloyl-ACP methyl ester carboxylesterase
MGHDGVRRHRSAPVWLVALFVVSALVVLAGCSRPAASPSSASPDAAVDRAGTVEVAGDRDIFLKCHGDGAPTVVLVSGLGDSAETWSTRSEDASAQTPTVYDGVADFTRVCAYDRPGTTGSRSSEVAQPTSAQISADDLQKLLVASGEAGPFVLAGHSYGGPIIRLFAGDHADEVAGLVLVDALSEDLGAGLTPAQTAIFEALNAPPQQSRAEFFDYSGLVNELRASRPAPDVPVIVLTADRPQLTPEALASGQLPPGVDQAFADALWAAQMAAQDLLPAKFSNATHITETASDHYIQLANPQLVIDAIRDVVDEARS